MKLIDVYPDEMASNPKMGGYELPVSLAIFRGRYRESFSTPKPLASNQPLAFQFGLPTANHTFQPGHRVMVQVQSSLFPLYDRNPQTYVPNIFFAKPGDYQKPRSGCTCPRAAQLHQSAGPLTARAPRAAPTRLPAIAGGRPPRRRPAAPAGR